MHSNQLNLRLRPVKKYFRVRSFSFLPLGSTRAVPRISRISNHFAKTNRINYSALLGIITLLMLTLLLEQKFIISILESRTPHISS